MMVKQGSIYQLREGQNEPFWALCTPPHQFVCWQALVRVLHECCMSSGFLRRAKLFGQTVNVMAGLWWSLASLALLLSCEQAVTNAQPNYEYTLSLANLTDTSAEHGLSEPWDSFSVEYQVAYDTEDAFVVEGHHTQMFGALELYVDGEWHTGSTFGREYLAESSGLVSGVFVESIVGSSDGADGWVVRGASKLRLFARVAYNVTPYGVHHFEDLLSPEVLIEASDGSSVSSDAYEPDNSMDGAKELVLNGDLQDRSLHDSSDQDWLYLSIQGERTYRIEVGYNADKRPPIVTVLDSDGDYVAHNAPSSPGEADFNQIVFTAAESGTAYLHVSRANYVDNYTLRFREH